MNKKINILIVAFLFLQFFVSCTKDEDQLTNKYWVKYKRSTPNYLVKFTEDGQYIRFRNLNESVTYQVVQNRIVFTDEDGEKEKFFIKSLTRQELKLSEITDVGSVNIDYFRAANERDYFLESWAQINKDGYNEFTFEPNGTGKVQEEVNGFIRKKEFIYSVKQGNYIYLDKVEYSYAFSKDIMDLELVKTQDKSKIILRRSK